LGFLLAQLGFFIFLDWQRWLPGFQYVPVPGQVWGGENYCLRHWRAGHYTHGRL